MDKQNNFLKKLYTKWQHTHYEEVCQMQVSLVKKIGGKCSPLYVSHGGVIKPISDKDLVWLKCTSLAHYLTCFFKLFCAVLYIRSVNHYHHEGNSTDKETNASGKGVVIGKTVIYLYFAISGFVGTGHLLLKRKQLANFFNFLSIFDQLNLGLGAFNSNMLMKIIAFQAPSITLGCSGIIGIQQYLQFEKPGSLSYPFAEIYKMTSSTVVRATVKLFNVGMTVYEWWNLTLVLGFCVMPGFCGLFVGFGAVYIGARTLFIKTRQQSCSLKESFCLYRRLQVLVSLFNECFQNDFAIWIMTFLMAWVVVTSAVISDQNIRNALASQEFYMCLCLLCEIYCFFVIGYTFPGKAHVFSKRIRAKWTKQLVGICRVLQQSMPKQEDTLKLGVLERRIIRSCQDIKIRFGSVNFYGRMTALVVTQFVVEKSLKLMLLMKK